MLFRSIASEGSFGPHSHVPFVPGGTELVLFVQRDTDFELFGIDVTFETNFATRAVSSVPEAMDFARQVQFPSHALIVMPARDGMPVSENIIKGITDESTLERAATETIRSHGQAWVETDMRAHLNPTRMRSIERATHSLVTHTRSRCPACDRPGFIVVEAIRGLPCADCGLPTQRARAEVFGCAGCGRRDERPLAGVTTASPGECGWCNP